MDILDCILWGVIIFIFSPLLLVGVVALIALPLQALKTRDWVDSVVHLTEGDLCWSTAEKLVLDPMSGFQTHKLEQVNMLEYVKIDGHRYEVSEPKGNMAHWECKATSSYGEYTVCYDGFKLVAVGKRSRLAGAMYATRTAGSKRAVAAAKAVWSWMRLGAQKCRALCTR